MENKESMTVCIIIEINGRIISIIIDYTLDKMFFQTKSKFSLFLT